MITKEQANKLKELINNFSDSQSEYDKSMSAFSNINEDSAY